MKGTLRECIESFLKLCLKNIRPPEDYSSMKERHDFEVEVFQKHCKHKNINTDFSPFIACSNCHKVLRSMTAEELEIISKINLLEINNGLKSYNVKLEFVDSECECERLSETDEEPINQSL